VGRPHRRSPSYKGFQPASEASSRAMRGNRARNTRPELLLREALRIYRLRYHTHEQSLPGRPDLVFPSAHLAVFCDGDFWHGRNWARLRKQLARRANAEYWTAKIAANRARDALHRRALRRAGWTVLRVWETDIRTSPDSVARQIAAALEAARHAFGVRAPRIARLSGGLRRGQGSRTR
jgi:DNA mismatch endonuclease (patch repair protein)